MIVSRIFGADVSDRCAGDLPVATIEPKATVERDGVIVILGADIHSARDPSVEVETGARAHGGKRADSIKRRAKVKDIGA